MTMPFDTLIGELAADLRPVRRLHSPLIRAAGWLAAVAILGLILAEFADLTEIGFRLRSVPDMWISVLGSTLTTILGAVAVFELSVPGRKSTWALLPLPGLALWIAGSGMGCLREWSIPGLHDASMRETGHCFSFIVGVSIPLSIVTVLMVRRAFPLRPNLTSITGGLAVASAAATLLNFFHPYDASATDIAVHVVAIAIVIGLNRLFGGRLLRPESIRPSM